MSSLGKLLISPWGRLSGCLIVIAVIWGVVLPQVATWPVVQKRKAMVEKYQIDPGALFYTDHESHLEIIAENDRRLKANPARYWGK
ncbi:MAG: hypothetical protein COA78_08900 [Blastopirellula sp.]|nr:MAG: hypothetical protein COA78_08900 [Blastopirellula sp.]